jgi:hypothetical protein
MGPNNALQRAVLAEEKARVHARLELTESRALLARRAAAERGR